MDVDEEYELILKQLQAEMAFAGFNYRKLADEAGLPYVTTGRYMRGERSLPVPTLVAMLKALGVRPEEFFARIEGRMGS